MNSISKLSNNKIENTILTIVALLTNVRKPKSNKNTGKGLLKDV